MHIKQKKNTFFFFFSPQILNAGKSIKFLHQVCHDRTPTKGQQVVQEIDVKQGDQL